MIKEKNNNKKMNGVNEIFDKMWSSFTEMDLELQKLKIKNINREKKQNKAKLILLKNDKK
jgi:hypothetical protein